MKTKFLTLKQTEILLLTETSIPSDAPDAAKLDIVPSGYTVVHRHRAASTERRHLPRLLQGNTGRRRRLQQVRVTRSKRRRSSFCVFRCRLRLSAAGHCHISCPTCLTDSPRLTPGSSLPVT